MGLSNYPPGHPQGYSEEDVTLVCDKCDTPNYVTHVEESATGTGGFLGDTTCSKCGKPLDEETPEEWK